MNIRENIAENGFVVIENIFTETEIHNILEIIENKKAVSKNFRVEQDLFAIRCFLNEFPEIKEILLNNNLTKLMSKFGEDYKIVKSIYFDKPIKANWIVNWHQDLTISVKEKRETSGFRNWLSKENYFSVQPTQKYLDNIVTVRIHLDNCTQANGALSILPKSHQDIIDIKNLSDNFFENKKVCEVSKGGILIMKPLIWHSSKRTENNQKRRVIHLEFSNLELPNPLVWAELT
jgi:ectoine hydroxylase-related dioxygenase (phytanoyl-CoA dioxygenase family)